MTLRNSAEILSSLLSRFAIIALDSEGRLQLWSRGAEHLLGWTAEEALGNRTVAALQLQHMLDGNSQTSIRGKNGTLIDVELVMGPWESATENTQGTVAILFETSQHRDLERKFAGVEQELLQVTAQEKEARTAILAERRFRELLEAAPDAIIEVDREGRIRLLNLATEKLFGYEREELLGQPVEILVPDALRAHHAQDRVSYWEHAVTRPMGSGLALHGRRKDGSSLPVEISLSPVKSEGGFRVTAIIRDISERRQTEDRFREMHQAYTRELESRNREVEHANQLKSEFLASMSHELRTPLHTIVGFSELLAEELEGPLNPKQHRFVNNIHQDSLHLLALINDILDISKIESGHLELHCEAFDIADALEETVSSLRPQGVAKSIGIETNLLKPQAIFADRLRIKQILYNLLSNALKFTPSGGKVQVGAAMRDGLLEVFVSDTGIGIPQEQYEAVFDKFYQLGTTTKGVREGTGLGLAITKSLVEEHGGRIWVESQPGKGSRFTFTIALEQIH